MRGKLIHVNKGGPRSLTKSRMNVISKDRVIRKEVMCVYFVEPFLVSIKPFHYSCLYNPSYLCIMPHIQDVHGRVTEFHDVDLTVPSCNGSLPVDVTPSQILSNEDTIP